ncbi:glycoside hydrolase family 73 protein [Lacticaseibacillus zeae]|uniref:Glycoside hydrolase family 73 protein n=1 Tax=Lacticaseibacillus zeae subsp. silagei TaxID=3068307 RepID=A0ABD7Z6W5_LACZE|nr:glycoside hydrolase family 73 protein [Lacticaseibacillus zeae]MDE3315673.1 glycoside hydrolase family 73 protein [Lacticaseibacillus zeae]WLV82729.1 glycoside hydrolase family 73 protein [Lacticaseibacillus sp. NCIMB 15475]WLV87440.1 glycoside hydrolase family 73 protein [Lacticaseibacillus sp. NCIMB 15474]
MKYQKIFFLTAMIGLVSFGGSSVVQASSVNHDINIARHEETVQGSLKQNSQVGPGFYGTNLFGRSLEILQSSPSEFLDQIKAGAIASWSKHSVLPSITAAQAALESGWGSSQLSTQANNLFGIKGQYNGQYVEMPTLEWSNGNWVTVNAEFRKYPDWSTSVEDHGNFFTDNSRYHNLLGVKDYKQVAQLLQQDGYATDPDYANKLISIIEANNLQSWDQEAFSSDTSAAGSLDDYSVDPATLKLRGWSVASDSTEKPISYLFAVDANTNQELARWKINRTERPDVQRAYPQITGSLNSGFDESLTIPDSLRGHQVRIMARYTSDPAGNNNASDFTFGQVISIPQVESEGHLDEYNVGQDTLTLRGWSAASNSTDKPISYLFALDANTNQELARWKINRTERPDVQRAYPQIPGSLNSGFDETFKLPDSLKGHQIRIMARYTSDLDGNNNASDFTFEQVINVAS